MSEFLDKLKGTLLFQNSMDIWIALCREKGWNRKNYNKYQEFINYLKSTGIVMRTAQQGHPIRNSSGMHLETYTMKFDDMVIEKVRRFK